MNWDKNEITIRNGEKVSAQTPVIVSASAVGVIINEFKNGINFWVIAFGIVAILFNPIIPIYIHNKQVWTVIDIIVALLILVRILILNKKQNE